MSQPGRAKFMGVSRWVSSVKIRSWTSRASAAKEAGANAQSKSARLAASVFLRALMVSSPAKAKRTVTDLQSPRHSHKGVASACTGKVLMERRKHALVTGGATGIEIGRASCRERV